MVHPSISGPRKELIRLKSDDPELCGKLLELSASFVRILAELGQADSLRQRAEEYEQLTGPESEIALAWQKAAESAEKSGWPPGYVVVSSGPNVAPVRARIADCEELRLHLSATSWKELRPYLTIDGPPSKTFLRKCAGGHKAVTVYFGPKPVFDSLLL